MTSYLATAFALAPDARALCRISRDAVVLDEEPILVDGLFPGESALVRLGRRRKGRREGRIIERATPPQREQAACPHVELCGGCRVQQLSYDQELRWKQNTLEALFPSVTLQPIQPSPQRLHYRNKMEWTFSQDRAGKRFLGLHGRYGRGVENVDSCALVRPWMSEALGALRSWWEQSGRSAYAPHRNEGLLRSVTFREGLRTEDRLICLLINYDERDLLTDHLESFSAAMQPWADHLLVRMQIAEAGRPTRFETMVLRGQPFYRDQLVVGGHSLQIEVSASAFAQPNPFCAELIYAAALGELLPDVPLIDLFAGTATIGLLAAQRGWSTMSVEINPDACADARRNQALNSLSADHQVVCADAGEWLSTLAHARVQLIVDPPRSGLGPLVCSWLVSARPERIIYISCNPKTQRADCDVLIAGGYTILKAQPFDQFPNTPHMEQMIVLECVDRG